MRTILLLLLIFPLAACDGARGPDNTPRSIESQAVMGSIPPDTVYRGTFVDRAGYICGLVLIEAGEFAEDAHIRFNTNPATPGFQASDGVQSDCKAGRMTVIDLVTGQSHEADAPASLAEAESFTRDYIELLLL